MKIKNENEEIIYFSNQNQNPIYSNFITNPSTKEEEKLNFTNKKKRKVPNQIHFQFQNQTNSIDSLDNNQSHHILFPSISIDSFLDPLALTKILSSHHVRTKMKPISSPRHHGRRLHKLTLSRTLISKSKTEPPSYSRPLTPNNLIQTSKIKSTPSHRAPQPNRISRRQLSSSLHSKHKSPSTLIKLKNQSLLQPPILANLYDPSLKIDQVPTTPISSFSNSKSSRISHPTTSDHHSKLDQPSENKLTSSDGYNGEFTFKLEMVEISQRLAGLHLAISADKKNRLVQIQEAIRIAMEKVDRPSIGGSGGRSHQITSHLESSDYHSPTHLDDERFLELGIDSSSNNWPNSEKSEFKSINENKDPNRISKLISSARKSHFLSPTTDSNTNFSNDHGPSGPPPSEPPPPLPHQQLTKRNNLNSSSLQVSSTNIAHEDNYDNSNRNQLLKKNQQQKGKKKRSAHANANNIHHRDNYIPSRLPNRYQINSLSGSSTDLLNSSAKSHSNRHNNDWSAVNFLAQDQFEESSVGSNEFVFIDPNLSLLLGPMGTGSGHSSKNLKKITKPEQESMKKQQSAGSHCQLGRSPISRFFAEPDEWICGFCEYQLWFGDEISLIKVIKNRKQVLRRRRRAKERAANGVNMKNVENETSNSNSNMTSNNKNPSQHNKNSTGLVGLHQLEQNNYKKSIVGVKGTKKNKNQSIEFNSNYSDQHNSHQDDDDDPDQYSKSSDDRSDDQIELHQLDDIQDQAPKDDPNLLPGPSSLFSLPKTNNSPTHLSSSFDLVTPDVTENIRKK